MEIRDFYFQEVTLEKSCGQFTCDAGHAIDTPCPGYEGAHTPTVYAMTGIMVIREPDSMSNIPVPFRSRKIAGLFASKELLDGGSLAVDKLIDNFEFEDSVEAMLAVYRSANAKWLFTAWYKPAIKGNNLLHNILLFFVHSGDHE
jgi:hypothetical protein